MSAARSTLDCNLGSGDQNLPAAKCPNCGGKGKRGCSGPCISGHLICPECGGHSGCSTCSHTRMVPCSTCEGSGEIVCSRCRGSGSISAN
jgi:hypothetical protein